jgi:hypothetical protein
MTRLEFLVAIDQALHEMRVIAVPNYSATDYVCVCSCDFEHVPVTTQAEAQAQVLAGCPIAQLEAAGARRKAARLAMDLGVTVKRSA